MKPIEKGDIVEIKNPGPFAEGWVTEMHNYIGKVGYVDRVDRSAGYGKLYLVRFTDEKAGFFFQNSDLKKVV
jgi:hypothetical protein